MRESRDEAFAKRIKEVKPLYPIFEHVQKGYGMTKDCIRYVNYAILDQGYKLPEIFFVFQPPRRAAQEIECIKQS